jgi:two-component system chemotaxis response regulator CheB
MVRDVIVVGAARGGAGALMQLIAALPADLPAAIFVVLHAHPQQPILLADAVNAPGRMRAAEAVDGEPIQMRRIYVAPNGKHLVLERDVVRVTGDGQKNVCQPSIDVLFRTAARSYKTRVVAIALMNLHDEGAIGLSHVRENGGRTVTHRNPEMTTPPRSDAGELLTDHHLDLGEIAPRIASYVHGKNGR